MWQTYDFKIVKVRLQAPKDIKWSETAVHGYPRLYFELRPVKPPIGIIDDTYYRIKITIMRTTKEVLQDEINSGLYKRSNESVRKFILWESEIHQQTERRDYDDYSYYRRDVILGDEHILSAHAELLNLKRIGKEEKIQEDIMVRRILDSIEPSPMN